MSLYELVFSLQQKEPDILLEEPEVLLKTCRCSVFVHDVLGSATSDPIAGAWMMNSSLQHRAAVYGPFQGKVVYYKDEWVGSP